MNRPRRRLVIRRRALLSMLAAALVATVWLALEFAGGDGQGARSQVPQPQALPNAANRREPVLPGGEARVAARPGSAARNIPAARTDDLGDEPVAAPERASAVKESEFYAIYTRLAAEDPAAFETEGRALLDSTLRGAEGPDCERVALLRASYDAGTEHASELFVLAARSLPVRSNSQGSSVPDFAVRYLGQRAASDTSARAALEQLAFGAEPLDPGLRRRAASHFASHASCEDLARLHLRLVRDDDPLLVEGVLASLNTNPNPLAASQILIAYGREFAPPDRLAQEP